MQSPLYNLPLTPYALHQSHTETEFQEEQHNQPIAALILCSGWAELRAGNGSCARERGKSDIILSFDLLGSGAVWGLK